MSSSIIINSFIEFPPAGGSFSPPDIAGLLAWYDAGEITSLSDNDPVATWIDSSASGFNATASGVNQPTYQTNEINGLPCVRFDGTNDVMASSYPTSQKPFTAFAVIKVTDVSDYRCIIGSFTNDGIEWRINATSGAQNLDKQATAGIGTSSAAVTNGVWTIVTVTYSGSGGWAYYFDGVADNSGTNDVSFSATTALIGAASGVHWFYGDMAEIVCYDTALSGPDLADVHAYLTSKYGL